MPSEARKKFDIALVDVEAHISHARSFAGGTPGAPAAVGGVRRPGRPFTHAAAVLLASALEGYVEAVVAETATALDMSPEQLKDLKEQIRYSHGANVRQIHALTAQIGLPFVLDTIGWNGLPSGGVRKLLGDLSNRRNKIAHGSAPQAARVGEVVRWRTLAQRLTVELDKKCATAVKAEKGTAPW